MTIKRKKGFSLIEMVVYIAILVFMLVIVIEVVFSIARSSRTVRAVRNVETSAISALERMGRELRKADSINTASSTLSTSPGVLSLSGEESGVAYSAQFYLSGGRVMLRENGIETGALTHASSTVTSLVFSRFYATSTEGIRIQISIESGTTTAYRVETFYSSVLLR